jgi:hypothetical protein
MKTKKKKSRKRVTDVMLSPVQLFNRINWIFEHVLREGRKVVRNNAVEKLPYETRILAETEDLIAINIGYYMQSPAAWDYITTAIKRYDDIHQRKMRRRLRTKDQLWDEMGGFLLTLMRGFLEKKSLMRQLKNTNRFVRLF